MCFPAPPTSSCQICLGLISPKRRWGDSRDVPGWAGRFRPPAYSLAPCFKKRFHCAQAPASPGCQDSRIPPAQSIFGSNSRSSSFSDLGHRFGPCTASGASIGRGTSTEAMDAFQNRVKTLNGDPLWVVILDGSSKRKLLNERTEYPAFFNCPTTSLSRLSNAGSKRLLKKTL